MLTFLYSFAFLLLPLPALVRWFAPPRSESFPAVRVPFMARLAAAGSTRATRQIQTASSLIVPAIVWGLLILALARPQWLEAPIERTVPTRDLLLLVDLSGSMDTADFQNESGESINRLDAAKQVLAEFLHRREGDRVGLVVFGNAPFLQVPFTTDLALCTQLLEETQVGMAGPRTAFGDAIGLGIRLFEESDAPQKTIIALTDGNDSASQLPPVEAARVARDNEITMYAVAIGDPTTVGEEKIDEPAMRNVAEVTGGSFFLALNRKELSGIYEQLDAIETVDVKTESYRPRRDLYFWPLAVALLLSIVSHAMVLKTHSSATPATAAARLRVNATTYELETVHE